MTGYPELNQIEDALVSAAGRLAARPTNQRGRRRPALAAALGLTLAISAVALAGAAGAGPLAGELHSLFGPDGAPLAPATLPPGASEVTHALGVVEAQGGRVLTPDVTSRHLTAYAYEKDGRVCLIVGGQGGIGHCENQLREAGGHLSVALGVVDSQAFVWGLASDDVTAVTVSIADHDYPTTLAHNAYFTPLPTQAIASQPITVTARLADGTTRVQHAPGLPRPAPPANP
jgi:hypothetical protein